MLAFVRRFAHIRTKSKPACRPISGALGPGKQTHEIGEMFMQEAVFIALGAAAIGLAVTFFSVLIAISSKKKAAAAKAAQESPEP